MSTHLLHRARRGMDGWNGVAPCTDMAGSMQLHAHTHAAQTWQDPCNFTHIHTLHTNSSTELGYPANSTAVWPCRHCADCVLCSIMLECTSFCLLCVCVCVVWWWTDAGVGYDTAAALASLGAHVVLACRSQGRQALLHVILFSMPNRSACRQLS